MDAAQKTHTNTRLSLLIALAFVAAAPGWSQTFALSTTSVTLNQSVTGADVTVGSSGDPITFNTSKTYAGDGSNGIWLSVNPSSATTPATVSVNIANVAGLGVGTFTATVTLTSTAPVAGTTSSF